MKLWPLFSEGRFRARALGSEARPRASRAVAAAIAIAVAALQVAALALATLQLATLTAATGPAAAAEPRVIPVDGAPFAGNLTRVTPPFRLEFSTPAGARPLSAADLVLWGGFVDASRGTEVLLEGGGLLVADVKSLEKETLSCDGEIIGAVRLPLESVTGVLWRPPAERAAHDRLQRRMREATGADDRVWLDNGDEVRGSLTALTEDHLMLDAAAGPTRIELSRVVALVFNPSLADRPRFTDLRAMLGLVDGSRLLATQLKLAANVAEIKAYGVGAIKLGAEQVVALQPLGGKAVYLSDLAAASYKHIPYLQLAWPYEQDANVLGGALRSGGGVWLKGLGLHSAARLTYALEQPYRFLQAELAIDDAAAGHGSVDVRVFVDTGTGRWELRYSSPTVRGGQPPTPMSVDLTGAKRISVLVEFADRGDERDEADLLNARLIK